MTKSERARYMTSREWGLKREAVKERCQGMCERCGLHEMYAVHHLTYERLGNESLDDLQALCADCHEYTHGKGNRDPIKILEKSKEIAKQIIAGWKSWNSKERTIDISSLMDLISRDYGDDHDDDISIFVYQSGEMELFWALNMAQYMRQERGCK